MQSFNSRAAWRLLAAFFVCILIVASAACLQAQKLSGQWQFGGQVLSNQTQYLTVLSLDGSGKDVHGEMIYPAWERAIVGAVWNGGSFQLLGKGGYVALKGEMRDGSVQISELDGAAVHILAIPSKGYAAFGAPPVLTPLPTVPANHLAVTPPMGWNSWNRFKDEVDDRSVRAIADAVVTSGMKAAGYTYINIDDTWEGVRDSTGRLQPNAKFPDMKALADYVHARGLKLGIYSSPGPLTCAGYPGSYLHEEQDAQTFADWGIDLLKYDWCSARRIYTEGQIHAVYARMGAALAATHRPIVFSLCEYGGEAVQSWGPSVGANLWRTTYDIADTWKSMTDIGFSQPPLAPSAGPSHWNDPDMLEVGNGGMTNSEYQVHMSLWSMLNAPLLAGNDLRSMSAETKALLMNRDVIAVDQDALGAAVKVAQEDATHPLWTKQLVKGQVAVALFNRSEKPITEKLDLGQFMAGQRFKVRNLWTQTWLESKQGALEATVAPHGVLMLRLDPQ